MRLTNAASEIFVPDRTPVDGALARTTHMAIGAHQDDVEIMAFDGILKCFGSSENWFLSVTATNGGGSPRDDLYAGYTDEDMQRVRRREQQKAAVVGEYAAAVLLDYSSAEVKDPNNRGPKDDIKQICLAAKPAVVYTHNLADKHDTHVAVALRAIDALRELPADLRPKAVYGCEVWRDLDWMADADKAPFDVSAHENLAASLLGVFDSQICGGKRYDLATMGRRTANATYYASHGVDIATSLIYAMDLTPLLSQEKLDIEGYICGYIDRFRKDVIARMKKLA